MVERFSRHGLGEEGVCSGVFRVFSIAVEDGGGLDDDWEIGSDAFDLACAFEATAFGHVHVHKYGVEIRGVLAVFDGGLGIVYAGDGRASRLEELLEDHAVELIIFDYE